MSSRGQKSSDAPRRGRPREYDPERALARAARVFWREGYAGTSFEALSAATRMSKPSLYGALGDKRDWYVAAVDHYVATSLAAMRDALSSERSLAAGLQEVYDRALALYFAEPDEPLGCFLVGTTATVAAHDAELRARLGGALQAFTDALERRFRVAIERRELARDADPAARGELAAAVLFSLALRARAGHSRAALRKFARQAVAQLAAP